MKYFIIVPGRPRPKGRPRFSNGRVYTPKDTLDYERHIRKCAEPIIKHPFIGEEITLTVKVYFSDKRIGDLDNYIKIAGDALNKMAYKDDRQVKHIIGGLYFVDTKEEQRMEITVESDETL